MSKWRFENLLPSLEGIIDAKWGKAIERLSCPLPTSVEQAKKDLADSLLYFDMLMVAERRYGFGRPMDEVVESLSVAIRWGIRRMEIILRTLLPRIGTLSGEEVDEYTVEILGFGDIIEKSLLIDSKDLLKESNLLVAEFIESRWPSEKYSCVDYMEVYFHLANTARGPSLATKWERFRNKQQHDLSYYQYVAVIISRDKKQFNAILGKHILERFGSERTRNRRRNITPSERLSLDLLGTVALALHNGIPLTFRDEAIPIHEFPITQRPEIKALLAKGEASSE
ncbi:hypothetical protein ACFL34_01690 [Candidatus Sumerlaeota bacterium]